MIRNKKKVKNPGGTGFQPVHSFQVTRRNLPHWQEPGSVYFITWKCKSTRKLDAQERDITLNVLRHWDGLKMTLYAAVVLPDHVHVLLQPYAEPEGGVFDLAEIIHSIKSYSAQKISQASRFQGGVWQDERFDRIVRDETEFLEKWNYIRNNPVKAGLCLRAEDYPWLYEKNQGSTG